MGDTGGPLPIDEAIAVLRDVVLALSDMGRVVIHRDIKPGNVLLFEDNWCLVDAACVDCASRTSVSPALPRPPLRPKRTNTQEPVLLPTGMVNR